MDSNHRYKLISRFAREKPLPLYNGFFSIVPLVGPSGLEPPTSCLSGTRSNLLSYEPMWLVCFFHTRVLSSGRKLPSVLLSYVSIELFSRTVARKVFSPLQSLTSVFGMGTGGPSAFVTLTFFKNLRSLKFEQHAISLISRQLSLCNIAFAYCTFSIERR